ncbi:hypothetical protein A6U96_14010 [Agrobacterium tumefaciens]|nr:hypothetical protein A6U96_14010 [Agrobacterium tumefaciens]
MPSYPTGAAVGSDSFSSPHVVCGTADQLFEFDTLTKNWKDVSRQGNPYASAAYEHWKFTQINNLIIATNFSDSPQVKNLDTNEKFSDLTTLVRGRHMVTHKGFVVLANTHDALDGNQPSRVRWSGQYAPTEWTFSQSTMSDFQDFPENGAIQGLVAQDDIYIFSRRGIGRMYFVGSPWIFQFETIVAGKGVAYPESIVTVQGRTFFIDDDGFYEFSRQTGVTPVGIGKINEYFLKSFDPAAAATMTAVVDPRRNLIYWNFASINATGKVPDTALIYNYQTGDWSIMDALAPYVFSSLTLATVIEELDVYGPIENIPAPFDSPIWSGGTLVIWGIGQDGKIWIATGENRQAVIETAELQLAMFVPDANAEKSQTTAIKPLQFGHGTAMVSVGTRNIVDKQVKWTQPVATNNVNGKAFVRTYDRYHRFRLTLNGNFEKVSGIEITFNPGGNR